MAIEGPLKELGIHDVFQLLDLSRKTGVLRVTSELRHNQGTVYFDDGAIVYAEVRTNPHPIGRLLVRAGKISDADVSRARDMQQSGDARRMGEILVAIGALTARELERQVRFQIEEVVFEVMGWREGYFSFEEGPLENVSADAVAHISTESVLMEGARRIDEWSRIEAKIPHLSVVPRLAPSKDGDGGEVDLLPAEWELLAAVDGERDLRTIAGFLGRSEFDVAKTVFGLEAAGLVELVDPGRVSASRAGTRELEALLERAERALGAGDAEQARTLAEGACGFHPQAAAAHLMLGRAELTLRHPAEAEEHLRRALRLDALLADGHRLLGDALARQGQLEQAAEWWERWLRLGGGGTAEETEVRRVEAAVAAARTLSTLLREMHA
jgi:hypothetical protein